MATGSIGRARFPADAAIKIKGDTDDTKIGNIGDSLKVTGGNEGLGVDPRPPVQLIYGCDPFLNGSNSSMDVNGATTSQDFTVGPGAGVIWYVESLAIFIDDPGSPDPNDFGSIDGGLTNGFQVLQEINSTEYQLVNAKNNINLALCFPDQSYGGSGVNNDARGWFNEDDFYLGKMDFAIPIKLDGDNGDQFIARVRDDLRGLNEFEIKMKYWRVI